MAFFLCFVENELLGSSSSIRRIRQEPLSNYEDSVYQTRSQSRKYPKSSDSYNHRSSRENTAESYRQPESAYYQTDSTSRYGAAEKQYDSSYEDSSNVHNEVEDVHHNERQGLDLNKICVPYCRRMTRGR